jgi:proteasome lid subunit RPN8/RPN11
MRSNSASPPTPPGTQTDPRRLWRRTRPHRPRHQLRRRHPRSAENCYAADPGRYFYPDQYNNPANWQAHYQTTALEILAQTDHRITHFVAAMGTSGTFVGTTRRLKEVNPAIQCLSAQPSSGFHGLEGLKHVPTAIVPGIYDESLADDNLWIETEDAYRMARRLARQEGLLVGISAAPMSTEPFRSPNASKRGHRRHPLRRRRKVPLRTLLERPSILMIRVHPEPWATIVAHAEATYPNECCGAMLGTADGDDKTVTVALPLENAYTGTRKTATKSGPKISSASSAKPASAASTSSASSTPIRTATPTLSKTDLENSCPWYSFIVLSIQKGKFHHANSWLPNAEQTKAEQEPLEY